MTIDYQVAISYASEDTVVADSIASRLNQDGYNCFYGPHKLHKIMGLDLPDTLETIYSSPSIVVVVLFSTNYFEKDYPQREYRAALSGGLDRMVPVRIGDVEVPDEFQTKLYVESSRSHMAIEVSQAVGEKVKNRVTPRPPLQKSYRISSEETVEALDNPAFPYDLQDVDFAIQESPYYVDVYSDSFEFESPAGYLTRLSDNNAVPSEFSHISREMILEAKADVRNLIEERELSGWPVFNGKMFGVGNISRGRSIDNDQTAEKHTIRFSVYKTDYFTGTFGRKLYARLSPDRSIRVDVNSNFEQYSGILASFGVNAMLYGPVNGEPHLLFMKRSTNVANAAVHGGMWHVSMNEGMSLTDGFAGDFDTSETFFRGFKEELNVDKFSIVRTEMYEPFLEYKNFEIGIFGAAYTEIDLRDVVLSMKRAADYRLENSDYLILKADLESIVKLRNTHEKNTNILNFCLDSIISRQMFTQ